MPGSKNWCFTLHSDEKRGEHLSWPGMKRCPVTWWDRHEDTDMEYLILQVEKAPDTGKIHLQGYIALSKRTTLASMKKIYSAAAHWETARGTPQENKDYCSKSESRVAGPWEFGTLPVGSGARTDLKGIFTAVKAEKSNLEILEATDGASAKFEKHINYIRFTVNEKKSDRQLTGVRVIVLYGATGVGKTYCAVNYFGREDYHLQECPSSKDSRFWFDGYQGQRTLILDDFSGEFCNYRYLLRVLDKYKLKVEIKGSFSWALWTTVVITTNLHPSAWYPNENSAPLQRRINEIRYCEHRDTYKLMDWAEHTSGDFVNFVVPPPCSPVTPAPTPSISTEPVPSTSTAAPNKRRRLRRTDTTYIDCLCQDKDKDKDKDEGKDYDECHSDLTDPDAN